MTTMKEWLPVRCCCTPTKVLGFLRVSECPGSSIAILDSRGKRHELRVRTIYEADRSALPDGYDPLVPIPTVHESAIYSEDRPLSFWRTIPGFLEVVDA